MSLLRPARVGALLRLVIFAGLFVATSGVIGDALFTRANARLQTASLDLPTACELVREYVPGLGSNPDSVVCHSIDGEGEMRSVAVTVGSAPPPMNERVFCVAKGWRWYVLSVPDSKRCAANAPPRPSPQPLTERAFLDQEIALRHAEEVRLASLALDAMNAKLDRVRKAFANHQHFDEKCARFTEHPTLEPPTSIHFVDRELLEGRAGWPMLTSWELGQMLDPAASVEVRSRAAEVVERRGSWLAVIEAGSEGRTFPNGASRLTLHGSFTGWLAIVDLSTAEPVCEGPLHFESSDELARVLRNPAADRTRSFDLLTADFQAMFRTAANARVDSLTAGALRLDLWASQ